MSHPFKYAVRLEQAVREVKESSATKVLAEGPFRVGAIDDPRIDLPALLDCLAQDGYPLVPKLHECFLARRSIGLHWCAAVDGEPLGGEFEVLTVEATPEVYLPVEDFAYPHSDTALLEDLRIVDDISRGGEGLLVCARYSRGTANPELYFLGPHGECTRLRLDYDDYLAALAITKGAYGWQYLFAEPPLSDYGRHRLQHVKLMLDAFPSLFPEHDYAPLISRLHERL
jgi:hypothetical protein